MELNERNIKAAQPGDVLRDATVKGLQLRCFPTKRTFYLYYRTKAGIERKPKLGDHGSITLSQARAVAQQMLAEVALGKDPAHAQRAARQEPTVAALWGEWRKRHGLRKKSADQDERIWRTILEPQFGGTRLSQVSYSAVCCMMDEMDDRPVQANRALVLLSTLLNFAIAPLEWLGKNPCKKVPRFKETARRRYATADEVAAIAAALARRKDTEPRSVGFLYLLILTGARKGEIAAATPAMLNGSALRLPDSKTGAKTVHLPPAAMDVIDTLLRPYRTRTSTLTGILSPKKLWDAVRVEAGCPDLRMHDLRHSFASAALAAGYSLDQIGELLGHRSNQTTKRYAHLVEEMAAKAAADVGDALAARMGITRT